MEKKFRYLFICVVLIILPSFIFSQDQNSEELSFEEYKAMKKKEKEEREAKEKEQEYKDYLEFQEYRKKKKDEDVADNDYEKKKKLGKIAYSPWAVQYSAISGLVGGTRGENGTASNLLVTGEYHEPESNLGYRVGLSTSTYSYQSNRQKYERAFLIASVASQGNLPTFFLANYFLFEKTRTTTSSAEFFVDYHFNPRKLFDPFLSIGFGVGSCENQCTSGKLSVSGGFRMNFKSGYVLTEVFAEKPYFTYAGDYYTRTVSNIHAGGFKVGFGIFL